MGMSIVVGVGPLFGPVFVCLIREDVYSQGDQFCL